MIKLVVALMLATFISATYADTAPKTAPRTEPRAALPRRLYIGPYESDTTLGGSAGFRSLIARVRPHGMNALALGTRADAKAVFDIAASEAFYLIFKTTYDMDRQWWNDAVPNTKKAASAAAEIVTAVSTPYLVAYDLRDEPTLEDEEKLCRIIDAVRAKDPGAAATSVLIGRGRGELLFERCRPDTLYLDVYPFLEGSQPGDFSMRAFGYADMDFTEYIRHFTRRVGPDTPLWVILQTHGTDWPSYDLRAPSPSELRAMQWLALGEGATGIFYFHWSSMQTWTGLKDSPALFREATRFARAVRPLERLIVSWRKVPDRFTASGRGYVSTLKDTRDGTLYALVVNREVNVAQKIRLGGPPSGVLTDLAASVSYPAGSTVELEPGEGKIFRYSRLRPKVRR